MSVYILARALYVPLVHDEARMFRFYIDTGVVLPPNALLDAGNHLLVSLVSYWSTLLFGKSLVAIRLFAVLSYPIYAYAIIALVRYVDERIIRVCFGLSLLTMPFLFEYFSLFRGYGSAVAFEAMGCLWLLRFIERGDLRSLGLMTLFMVLAAFACLSLLPVCCIALVMAVASFALHRERLVQKAMLVGLGGGLPVLFLAYYGNRLNAKGGLYFGGVHGLAVDVAGSLARWTLDVNAYWLAYSIATVVFVAIVWAVFYFFWKKHDPDRIPLFLFGTLLILLCTGTSSMHVLLDTPYPIERTAIHFIPITLLLLAFALDRARSVVPGIVWLSPFVLVFPMRTSVTANVDHTSVWADQAIGQEVFDVINSEQEKAQRPLVVNALKYLGESWDLGRRFRGDVPMSLDSEVHPQPICDLMITDPEVIADPEGFNTIHVSPTGRLVVWKREEPLHEVIVFDTTYSVPHSDRESVELWRSLGNDGVEGQPYFVEIELVATDDSIVTQGLITDVHANDADEAYYDRVELSAMQRTWNNTRLHVIRRIPAWQGRSANTAVFLYNPERNNFELKDVHVRVYAIDP